MKARKANASHAKIAAFLGNIYAHNNSMKLYHWRVTGTGSYARHLSIDQALETLVKVLDRLVETSIALYGDLDIVIPKTAMPEDVVKHCADFYDYIEKSRALFTEAFTQSIIDDYHEAQQQLLYRMIRLK